MKIEGFSFGSIIVDGVTYEHDIVIEGGEVRKRKKKRSRKYRDAFGHTPLSLKEPIPWNCRRLIVGTGAHGALPVMDEVKREAERRQVELVIEATDAAVAELGAQPRETMTLLPVMLAWRTVFKVPLMLTVKP
jgi:hypothetical protein